MTVQWQVTEGQRQLAYRSPREFIASRANETTVVIASENYGATTGGKVTEVEANHYAALENLKMAA